MELAGPGLTRLAHLRLLLAPLSPPLATMSPPLTPLGSPLSPLPPLPGLLHPHTGVEEAAGAGRQVPALPAPPTRLGELPPLAPVLLLLVTPHMDKLACASIGAESLLEVAALLSPASLLELALGGALSWALVVLQALGAIENFVALITTEVFVYIQAVDILQVRDEGISVVEHLSTF